MAVERKKKQKKSEGAPDWLLTYGDMTTLLLTFFIMMFTTAEIDGYELRMILAAFQGLGTLTGGTTLQTGKLAELGNTVMSLPSMEQGAALDKAVKKAISLFEPEIKSNKVVIRQDERGIIISLASDAFFRPGSADIDIEETRDLLQNLATILSDEDLADRKFRIEGHTDNLQMDPGSPYATNWELSAARAINTLKYLVEYGANEKQFGIAGYAANVPYDPNIPVIAGNQTEEARSLNRRVDIIILTDAHQ